jgi:hypothetical protein
VVGVDAGGVIEPTVTEMIELIAIQMTGRSEESMTRRLASETTEGIEMAAISMAEAAEVVKGAITKTDATMIGIGSVKTGTILFFS